LETLECYWQLIQLVGRCMGIPIYNMSDKGNIFCKNNDMIQFGESMIRFIPMKVVTIQAIYESNQSNQNEG